MSSETDELRDFGRQENEYVLSGIFNPDSATYRHVDYVRKTAQDACSKAERTFGASDVLHIEALANLALFHWRREEDPKTAAVPLERAKALFADQAAQFPELATELIAVQLLLHLLERRNESELGLVRTILNAAEFAWRVDRADEPAAALKIVSQMIGYALRSNHKVLPSLVCEVGRPFAFDLVAQGRRSDAARFLIETLFPLAVEVWGSDSLQALSIEKEAGWLAAPSESGIQRDLQLDRMIEHVRNLVSEPRKPRGRRRARNDAGNDARQSLHDLIAATFEDRAMRLGGAISALEAVWRSRQAMTHVDDDTGEMIVALACLIFATDDPDRQRAQERAIGLAHWWRERSYGEASRTTKLFRDRVHVILADFYRQRVGGDPEDNLNEILIYTDSLDLEPHDAPYHWGLGKLLRGFAYARRQEWKSVDEPGDGAILSFQDANYAIHFFEASLETLKEATYPWEWAHVLLYWSDAVLTLTPAEIEQAAAEVMIVQLRSAEEVLTPLVAPAEWARIQKDLSEIARRPLSSADGGDNDHDDDDDDETKAEIDDDEEDEKLAEEEDDPREDEAHDPIAEEVSQRYVGDPPVHILTRAQLVLDGDQHGELRAGLEIEKARYFVGLGGDSAEKKAISAYRTGLANLPQAAARARFAALRELGVLLFARGAFAEAADAYEKALAVGQARLESSYSMNARRVAIFDLGGIAHDLAFCQLRAGNLERAIITLDEGKSILLNDNLRARYASRLLRGAGPRSKVVRMASKLRRLEAEAYGGMQYSESTAKLIELRGEFSKLDVPPRAAFSLRILRDLPDGCVIVAPVVTRHGTSVILARGVPSGPAALSAVEIPALTDMVLKTRLFGEGAGWFDAYRKRNEYGVGEEAFTDRVEDACDWLGETLFAPLIAHLDGQDIRELILVPSGGLQFLPLHAASLGKGSEKSCLVEHFVVRAVPSLATLALLQSVAREGAKKGSAIVAGVSVYNDVSLNPLPNAVNEVKAVAEILGAHPILDEQVTPSTLAAGLKRTSILHLACHGAPWAEDIGFDRSYSPSPVLRLRKKGLSFRDILVSWDLESTELVTLSACDTGLVTFSRSSDEFEGLAHILLQAGARRVVASLWSVDDQSTALLMRRFYANLRGGLGFAAALTQAQKWLRSATHQDLIKKDGDLYDVELSPPNMSGGQCPFAHPIYWAPFFLTG